MQNKYSSSEISVSIGIALYPDHGEGPDQLVRMADMAMYTAKHKGRDRYSMTNPNQLFTEEADTG
jgi:diguanylate cyclase (GGDEF)-like protein